IYFAAVCDQPTGMPDCIPTFIGLNSYPSWELPFLSVVCQALIMIGARKLTAWLVLASYLFANTLAASWHAHPGQTSCPATPAEHHHHADHHCTATAHHHRNCDRGDAHHADHDQRSDEDQGTPHQCVICEFLGLAPLPAAVPALIDAGQAVAAEI